MPLSKNNVRVKLSMTPEQKAALETHADKTGQSMNRVILTALGQIVPDFDPDKLAPHGGQRYHQCGNCYGWNVGPYKDGYYYCADCGWRSEKPEATKISGTMYGD
jgi:hypothetical protein